MNLSDMNSKTGERRSDPFQPIKLSAGHVSRAGQFNLSFNSGSEVLEEVQSGKEVGSESYYPRKKPVKLSLIIGGVILVIGLLGSSLYFYARYQALKGDDGREEIALYLKQLDQIMVLPSGEEPTLATVTDKDKLSGQLFFANAQNGDKVLVFSQAGKAVLYRPQEGKIVEMMALSGSSAGALGEEKTNTETK